MATPFHVISHSPSGHIVPVNSNIVVEFNEKVDPLTVNPLTLTIVEADTLDVPRGTVITSGAQTQLVFQPESYLNILTKYRVSVPTPGIKDVDGNNLADPFVWNFTTSQNELVGGSEIEWAAGQASAVTTRTPTLWNSILTNASGTIEHGDGKISTTVKSLELVLNGSPSGTFSDLSGYFGIKAVDVLGYTLTGDHIAGPSGYFITASGNAIHVALPTGAVSGSTFLANNAEYTVTLKSGATASGFAPTTEDQTKSFMTEFYPMYTTDVLVRLFAGPFVADIPDDTIRRVALQHSRKLTVFNGSTVYGPVPYYVTDYVTCQTAVDVIRQEFSAMALKAGEKHLGDLSIDADVTSVKKLMDDTIKHLQACADEAFGLVRTGGRRVKPLVTTRGKYNFPNHSRLLQMGDTYVCDGPASLRDSGGRREIIEKWLNGAPLPSRLHWGQYIYTVTNYPLVS
jgi:hypothetical protein